MDYELVIGLETHIELSTNTKIFCSCKAEFGGEPNSHCCPICLGLPGVLPMLNKKVVTYAIMAGLATNCKIAPISKMDRKNYIYPDLSKAYQISQFDMPLCEHGSVLLSNGRTIGITRIHIEEDAGKLLHNGGDVYVDYNRGGVPLIEIVSEPDFRSATEVREYLENLQLIMRYIGVSDCKMQEGSLRCDVNISVRPKGQKEFGTRTEIKNMNSFTFIVKAIESEYNRQVEVLSNGGKIIQATRRFNEATSDTETMREKEDSHDYRYFKDPDLVTILTSNETIEKIKQKMPELPSVKTNRYINEYSLSELDASLIIKYKKIADFFDELVENTHNPKMSSSIILSTIFKMYITDEEKENANNLPNAKYIAEVITLMENKKINSSQGKIFIDKIIKENKPLNEIASADELSGVSDDDLQAIVDAIVADNEKIVSDYRSGKEKAIKALIGMVMRNTKGKADPTLAETMIISSINK
ncbi:MAG: Asp-tRNA(Asn)/Glu-tRNA(Gln) amidotransferase subunit GatB [Clostridia bacterium]